jgi:hypothetical protein
MTSLSTLLDRVDYCQGVQGALQLASVAAFAAALACSSRDEQPEPEPKSPTTLPAEIVDLDSALAPRGDYPLIAGEPVRLVLSIGGGTPPFDVKVITSSGDPALAQGGTTIDQGDPPLEAALELPLSPAVKSGHYGLAVQVSSASGSANLRSEPFEVIGADAPQFKPPQEPPFLQVVDVAGRARQSFYPGEALRVVARFKSPGKVAVGIVASDETELIPRTSFELQSNELDMPLTVPRLIEPGSYGVAVVSDSERAVAPLNVAGKPFPPAGKLGIDGFTLYGGDDLRTPRRGILKRGEKLRVEARVAGGKSEVSLTLRLRTRRGKLVVDQKLVTTDVRNPDPRARFFTAGTWTIPPTLKPGRHMLEVEVIEGDDVATLYREILLR